VERHKDFEDGIDIDEFEPLYFTLSKQRFDLKPAIQGSVLLKFVAAGGSDDGGAAAAALYDFFKECMETPEYDRFTALLNDPKKIFNMEKIGEIAGWMVEEYAARPTKPPTNSASGQSTSGPLSMVAQS
jgi:hypothetical protein